MSGGKLQDKAAVSRKLRDRVALILIRVAARLTTLGATYDDLKRAEWCQLMWLTGANDET